MSFPCCDRRSPIALYRDWSLSRRIQTHRRRADKRKSPAAVHGEAEAIRDTLTVSIEDENAFLADPDTSKKEKNVTETRVDGFQNSLYSLDPAVQKAEALLATAEQDLNALSNEYDDAFDQLTSAVEEEIEADEGE